jgi:hypothetical protein
MGTSQKLRPGWSCNGARTPLRLNRRRMGAHARATVATSSTRLGSAPGADALCRRCMNSACKLVSLPFTPRERQAGCVICICSRPQARRRRASGRPRSPLLGKSCCELALVVAAAAITYLLNPTDGVLAKLIRQRHKLPDVLRERLHHGHHCMRLGTASYGAGERERC